MKKIFAGIFIPTLLAALMVSACTPGKAQTKQNINNEREIAGGNDYNFEDKSAASIRNNVNQKVNYVAETGPQATTEYTGSEKFYQKGLASWYGREFQGKTTASGERFNMNEYTAAHKELPFGTLVDIKNVKNGKTVRVKINDRGPYRDNRIVDLSYAAANELGFIRDGETMVGINIIQWGDGARKSAESASADITGRPSIVEPTVNDYDDEEASPRGRGKNSSTQINRSLQTGAFYSQQNAENFRKKLEAITNKPVTIIKSDELYKVRIEGFDSTNDINRVKKMLESENIPSFAVTE